MKKYVAVVLLFNQGKVLGVSRKDNHADFGLPGGKLEEGESFHQAAIRETKEETGLDIFGLQNVFNRMDGDFLAMVFVAQWKGEIVTTEKGKVEWVTFEELKKGSFGDYNTALEKCLIEVDYFNNKKES